MAINASSVSRRLRAAGIRVINRRDPDSGIRVSNGPIKGHVIVTVDLETAAGKVADTLEEYFRNALIDTGIGYRRDGVQFTLIDAENVAKDAK